MKCTVVIGSLLATSVMAKPFVHKHHKRAFAFVAETDTVFTTVTAGQGWGSWGSWGGDGGSGSWGGWSSAPSATEAAAVPVVTESPLDGWTPSPPPPTEAAPAAPAVVTVWTSVTMGFSPPSPAPAAPAPAAPAGPPAGAPPSAPAPMDGAPSPAASAWGNAPSAAPQGSGPGGIDIAAVLDQHNGHRSNHSAPPLTWDTNLASIAQQIAQSCVYAHNTAAGGGGYGQNIGAGTSAADVPSMITNEMYNDEFGWYPQPWGSDNPDMSNFEHWGHLSQIVWASTTTVGCAWVDCSGGGLANTGGGVQPWFTVCNYGPPGNFAGEYSNVHAPGGAAVAQL